jgi:LAS superfamily LD-carboxypeptidase LdcB
MRNKLHCSLFVTLLLAGCAAKPNFVKETANPALPSSEAPPLTEKHLLGLRTPHGLITDSESGQFALEEVMEAYFRLREKAARDGWRLILVSGYRSFGSQRRVWNHYDKSYQKMGSLDVKGRVRAIMSTVSVPGLSRHHWGTELDISEETLRGQLVKIQPDTPQKVLDFYTWMEKNATEFGFCRVYLGKHGAVMDEPWHWSYYPFSRVYEKQLMNIKDFSQIMDIKVANVEYLMKNFPSILKKEIRSVNTECSAGEN